MIKSMTGFGRSEYSDEKRNVTVEIKTVNHRYFDVNCRVPRRYSFVEDKLKALIKETVKRGKVEVSVAVENLTDGDTTISLNLDIAKAYIDRLNELKANFQLNGEVDLTYVATLPEVMKSMAKVADEEEILNAILTPTEMAANNLNEMRLIEGEKLAKDILRRKEVVAGIVAKIAERAASVPAAYRLKLEERLNELLDKKIEIPEDRIITELAIFADKCNIDEEITRLKSHLSQFESIVMESGQPDGKKMDFIIQEMNREANTIGSKANDLEITNMVIEIKAEIEKIREQVQNIE